MNKEEEEEEGKKQIATASLEKTRDLNNRVATKTNVPNLRELLISVILCGHNKKKLPLY